MERNNSNTLIAGCLSVSNTLGVSLTNAGQLHFSPFNPIGVYMQSVLFTVVRGWNAPINILK